MFGLVSKERLDEALRKIADTEKLCADLLKQGSDKLEEATKVVNLLNEEIAKKNKKIENQIIDCTILIETLNVAIDIMKDYDPITSKYHALIIKGEATPEDVRICSSIVKKIIKKRKEFHEMIMLCSDIEKKKYLSQNFNFSVVK